MRRLVSELSAGAGWADLSFEKTGRAGAERRVSPNLILLMWPDGGMASRGVRGARTNPNKETVISNLHRVLRQDLECG